MKKKNLLTTKKCAAVILAAVLSVGMLIGCGKKEAAEEPAAEVTEEAAEPEAPAEEAPAEEEEVTSPFLADLEKYDSIISTLTTEQYYAFAGIGEDYDALLVTDGVFDNGDGNMATISAVVYGIDANGEVCYAGNVWSDGTAYPLAVYENVIMFGGNHQMASAYVKDGAVIIEREAFEEFDENGTATYTYDDGDIDDVKTVEDNSILAEMYAKYEQAVVINFTQGEAEPMPEPEPGDYPSNAFEERVGKTSFDSYDEIIGLLEGDEAYALVKVYGYDGDVLVITEGTFDDLEGHMAAIECTPYTMKANGKCSADGVFFTGGTGTPVALSSDGFFFTATHETVDKQCYGTNDVSDDAGIMVMAYVYAEDFDDNGTPATVGGFTRTVNSVAADKDDTVNISETDVAKWKELFGEYQKAEPINFTPVSK